MSIQSNVGYVIVTSPNYRVREKLLADGSVQIVVHQVKKGVEQIPKDYVLGSNMLVCKLEV